VGQTHDESYGSNPLPSVILEHAGVGSPNGLENRGVPKGAIVRCVSCSAYLIYMINIGDTVSVHFNNAQFTLSRKAKVVFMANETGDFWGFEDLENGMIHYVSEPCTITKETVDPEDIPF